MTTLAAPAQDSADARWTAWLEKGAKIERRRVQLMNAVGIVLALGFAAALLAALL